MDKSVNERIKKVLKNSGISLTSYGTSLKEMSLSKFARQLSGENAMTIDVVIAILRDFPGVSPDWLLFGRGKMLVVDNLVPMTGNENDMQLLEAANETLKEKIKGLEKTVSLQESLIIEKDKRLAMFEGLLHGSHEDYVEEIQKKEIV